ncbi:MAG: hypothetical protein JJ965_13085 [Alphaproteobacteria bacterium]|nr:hypothetical protein [Alphaproteobacteria bacterium]
MSRLGIAAVFIGFLSSAAYGNELVVPGSFSVSEAGAASYSIDIEVPPGTGGVEPKLSLSYSSQGGNGLLGMGWSLSGLSSIGRCPQTVAQDGVRGSVKFDGNDRFCLDGSRLIAVSGTYNPVHPAYPPYLGNDLEYRTEQESFAKIISSENWGGYYKIVTYPEFGLVWTVDGSGPQQFVVQTKSGLTMTYGGNESSRTYPSNNENVVLSWRVNRVEDTLGNFMDYTYVVDGADGFSRPSRIDYTGNGSSGPYASVRFEYEARSDVPLSFHEGAKFREPERLKAISTYVGDTLITRHSLSYEYSPQTGRSRLVSVEKCDAAQKCLPPTVFSFPSPTNDRFSIVSNLAGQDGSYLGMLPTVGDFDGDGFSDISWSYAHPTNGANVGARNAWIAQGNGNYAIETNVAGQNLNGKRDHSGDFEGSGYDALLMHIEGSTPGSGGGGSVLRRSAPNNWVSTNLHALSHKEVQFGDFDGDGRTDIFQIDSASVSIKSISGNFSATVPSVFYLPGLAKAHISDFNGESPMFFGRIRALAGNL